MFSQDIRKFRVDIFLSQSVVNISLLKIYLGNNKNNSYVGKIV